MEITINVNGQSHTGDVEPMVSLANYIREHFEQGRLADTISTDYSQGIALVQCQTYFVECPLLSRPSDQIARSITHADVGKFN